MARFLYHADRRIRRYIRAKQKLIKLLEQQKQVMRGDDRQPDSMFSYVSAEQRVPQDHLLRVIRALVDDVPRDMSREFDRLYASVGRPSIPPERLLRAQLLQIFYSITGSNPGGASKCFSIETSSINNRSASRSRRKRESNRLFGVRAQRARGQSRSAVPSKTLVTS